MISYKISGIFAPVPTPFLENGEVAYDAFVSNIIKLGSTSLNGVVVLGSNGEAVSLRENEKIKLLELARKHLPATKKIVAGVGCESLHLTTDMCAAAAKAGSDAVLVINPTYFRAAVSKPEVMINYFKKVADQSPLPMMLYNMPRNTGINVPADVICKAGEHDNIIGVKDSGGDIAQISAIIRNSKPGFCIFAGSASFLLPTLYMGGCGGTLATANVAPDMCTGIVRALEKGDHDTARKIQMDILELNAAVTSGYGIGGLKYAMELLGYFGGPCRSPLGAGVSNEAKAALRSMLERLQLLKA